MLPLPAERSAAPANANKGLVFSKFVDKWPNHAPLGEFKGLGGPEKKAWIDSFSRTVGDKSLLSRAADDIQNLAMSLREADDPKPRKFKTTGPFLTGMGLSHPIENGFLWHHTLGVPYLPGSSIKGMIRAWVRDWCGEDVDTVWRLFGGPIKEKKNREIKPAAAGNIIFFDALPTKPVKLYAEVITPHDGGWRISPDPAGNPPADWISPNPIPFLAVAEGAEFLFALAPRKGAQAGDLETAYLYLHEALEWIGAGAKTAVGFGRFLDEGKIAVLAKKAKIQIEIAKKARTEADSNAPPAVGEMATHPEWGTVEVKKIDGKNATVYSIDEAKEVDVILTDLSKK